VSSIFTVPPGQPFLDAIATAVLRGDLPRKGGTPTAVLDLPAWTIMLPTRRASRALQDAFLRASGGKTMLLPRIVPIAEGNDDAGLLAGLAGIPGLDRLDIPPAIDGLDRQLVLARLVMQWSKAVRESRQGEDGSALVAGARSTAEAITLAGELARLIDMVETEDARLDGLATMVPDHLSRHWQETLDFLRIVTAWWPAHLAESNLLSPADRRNRLLRAEARRLAARPPEGPVVVAGVTGSIPATADVMAAVAALPNGAIVLPALDRHLDDDSWDKLLPCAADKTGHPEHPQFGFAKLLQRLGRTRADVTTLGTTGPAAEARARLVSQALRPASTTERWRSYLASVERTELEQAMAGVSLVEAATAAEEAEVVALVLRKALETPGATAALVSPDRRLARRVAIRLEAYELTIDDSAGKPLAKTPAGTFLELVLDAIRRAFEPAAVVALLGHPLTRLGRSAREIGFAARSLEVAALRELYLGRGIDGLARALDRAEADKDRRKRATRRLWPEDWQRARSLVADLRVAVAPLTALFEREGAISLRELAATHVAVAEALAAVPADEAAADGSHPLWQGEAGETASLMFARLADPALGVPDMPARDYPDVFRTLFGMENVRQRGPVHPHLAIWGPFESRLQQPDVVVLGALNDGTWPEAADPGPWLNRPMREALGLPSPEERIGYAAHDVWALLGAKSVVMTRSLKVDGSPTVESRWLLRLKALLAGSGAAAALTPEEPWLAWVRDRDRVPARRPYAPPEPRPALTLRPRKLSVSAVETWISNPYALFASRILGLEALPALGTPPDGALRGQVLHEALGRFTETYPTAQLPADIASELMAHLHTILNDYTDDQRVVAFWLPRFERFADWFAATEPGRRAGVTAIAAEARGQIIIPAPAGPFTLTARADRIDATPRGYVVIDYKSGTPPDKGKVRDGHAPQLSLEAAILIEQGIGTLSPGPVSMLRFVRAGGGESPGEVSDVVVGVDEVAKVANNARVELAKMVANFDNETTPYRAVRRARFNYDYDDYAHLARVDEWSADNGEAE